MTAIEAYQLSVPTEESIESIQTPQTNAEGNDEEIHSIKSSR